MTEELNIRPLSVADAARLLKVAPKTVWAHTLPTRHFSAYTPANTLRHMDAVVRERHGT
jgi:hypothetical protein